MDFSEINLLDLIILLIAVVSILHGLWRGMILQIFSLGSVIVGFIVANLFYREVGDYISAQTGLTSIEYLLSYSLLLIAVSIVGGIAGLFVKRYMHKLEMGWMDRLGGAGIGFVKALIVGVIIVVIATAFIDPKREIVKSSRSIPLMLTAAEIMVNAAPEEFWDRFQENLPMVRKNIEGDDLPDELPLPTTAPATQQGMDLFERLSGQIQELLTKEASGNRTQRVDLESRLQEGDILFQPTMGQNAKLVAAITGSQVTHCGIARLAPGGRWLVLEAVGPVKETPLAEWMARTGGRMAVLRPKKKVNIAAVLTEARSHLGRPYDVLFQWDDARMYCSELIYKAYDEAAGLQLGELERIQDLNLGDGVQLAVFQERLLDAGLSRDGLDLLMEVLQEKTTFDAVLQSDRRGEVVAALGKLSNKFTGEIITPLSMYLSPELETVAIHNWPAASSVRRVPRAAE